MKKIILGIIAGSMFVFQACNAPEASTEASDKQEVATVDGDVLYTVDIRKSTVKWKGSKITGANHFGTVGIESGALSLKENSVLAGSFVLDMTSLALPEEDIDSDDSLRLLNHLRNPDFFNVDTFPQARFEIAEATTDSIIGNLTIKGITNSIAIPYSIAQEDKTITLRSEFSIDRTAWDIRYKSQSFFDDLGNKAIRNAIEFDVRVVVTKEL